MCSAMIAAQPIRPMIAIASRRASRTAMSGSSGATGRAMNIAKISSAEPRQAAHLA